MLFRGVVWALFAFGFGQASGLRAEDQNTGNTPVDSPGALVHTVLHDEYRIWTSPFRRSSYNSHAMKKYGVPFLLISAGLIASDRKTATILPNTNDQTKWSGRVSQIGSVYGLVGVAGGTWLLGKVTKDRHLKETGFLGLQALAHTEVVVFGLKEITQRERPLENRQHGGFWQGGNSFPSGHSAGAFALATVFAYEYWDHPVVPIASYSLASLVAISRLGARQHWVSDIFVGGSLGFLMGRFVYKQHHDPSLPGSPVRRAARLIPAMGYAGHSASMGWRF